MTSKKNILKFNIIELNNPEAYRTSEGGTLE
jgi:hypothetical protein